MKILSTLIPIIITLGVLAILMTVHFAWKGYRRRKKKRSPFTDNFLRRPGQSLLRQLDDINMEISLSFFYIVVIPLAIYAVHVSQSYFGGVEETLMRTVAVFISGAVFTVFFLIRLMKFLNRKKVIQLGYEGEVEVGQRLNQMMLEGMHVYHDFPAEMFNIDHIVVGSSGVYAIETKARSKPTTNNKAADAKVIYNGKSLKFPSWTDTKTLDQAKRQVVWLSRWVSSAVGEQVSVQPIVALPGWFVERQVSADGMFVINPKQFKSVIKPRKGYMLDDSMIKRIIHQLEQKCRDVIPNEKAV